MKLLKKTLAVILVMLTLFTTCTVAMPVFAENEEVNIIETKENTEPEIISEITEKREENIKHFLMSDGSFVVAQYDNPVHYQDDSGQWLDINNTISEIAATTEQTELFGTDKLYSTNNIAENVVFADKSNSNTLVAYEAKDYPISFNYQSAKKSNIQIVENNEELAGNDAFLTLPNVTQEVLYENVFTDVDLQYIVSPDGLKENIILKSKRAQNKFTVNYNIGKLKAEVVDEHTINLMADNEIIYIINAPYMIDGNGERSDSVTLNVDKNKNGKLRINIVVDNGWLQDDKRAYPVKVDPAIFENNEKTIDGVCVTNGTVSESDFNLSYNGSYVLLNIGTVESDSFVDHVALAELHLPIISNSSTSSTRVYLKRVSEAWINESEEIIKTNPQTDDAVVDYENVSKTANKLDFDITRVYTDLEYNSDSHGIKLEMVKSGSLNIALSCSDYPVLTVRYMNTCGLDMTMPMTAFDMGSAGCVYINNYSGNLVITRENEISTTGEEYPYDLSMVYNSFSSSEEVSGWLPSYASGFNYLYAYKDSDGTLKVFDLKEVVGLEDLYEVGENDYGWEHLKATSIQTVTIPMTNITLKIPLTFDAWKNNSTEKHSFNISGLQKIVVGENLNTNEANVKTIFSRESIADSDDFYLVDGDGDKLRVHYGDTSYVVTQYDFENEGNYKTGDSVTYIGDVNGNITEIKRGDKVEATFEYSDGKITKITDNNNHSLDFTYKEGTKRIESVVEWKHDENGKNVENGQTYSFQREINNVITRTAGANGVFGDDDDRLVTSRFSPDLKLLGESYSTVSSEYLGAVSYDRDEDESTTSVFDDIKRVGVVGKTPNNLLKNHNIESETNWNKKTIADSSATYTASLSDEKSYVGLNSFKVVTTDFTKDGEVGYCQTITPDMGLLQLGGKYVASAYINASAFTKDADTLSSTSYGAFVMVEIETPLGTVIHYSNPVTNTGDEWERAFLTFDVPQNFTQITIGLIGRNAAGTAYFDAVQLEEGDYPGQYNMLENNSFDFVNANGEAEIWERRNLTSNDVVENGEMKITGTPDKRGAIYQAVNLVNASQSDTYTLSCWAKADAMSGRISTRHYSVSVLVTYKDQTESEIVHASKLNNYDGGKQFISGSFSLKHPDNSELIPIRVGLLIAFYRQCNTAFFDDIALFRSAEVYDLTEGASEESATLTETCEHYNNDNIKKRTVTENGVVTVYNYDEESGKLTEESVTETITEDDASTSTVTTSYTYNANGDIATYTDEEGVVHTYSYNNYGDVVSILKPDGTGDTFEYDIYDTNKTRIKKETYSDGTVYEYTYYSGDILKTEKVTGVDSETPVEVYNYDENGNLISYTIDNVLKESYTYTVIGGEYLVATETADGYVTTYSYNADSEIISKVKTLNGAEVEKDVYEYDTNDKYLSKHSHTENGATLTTHYNSDGAVTKVEHNGFEYNYAYDNFGNTTSVKVGTQPLITYSYLPDKSKLSGITYGNGDRESYTYNAYGQPLKKTVSSLGDVEYRYDNSGNLAYQTDELSDRRTYFNYDLKGNFIGQKVYINSVDNTSTNFLFSSANVYDEEERVTRKDMQGVHYALDAYYYYDDESGLISSVATTIGGSRRLNYTYDDEQRVVTKSMTTKTPVNHSYAYNGAGLISNHTIAAKNGTFAYTYTYDDNGNITEIKLGDTVRQRYVYDETNQLVREDNLDINKTVVYNYDGYGNILNKKEYAFTTGDLGAVTDTITYGYDTAWKDKLTSYDGQSITYDAIGNPTNYRGIAMTWNGRKLMSYAKDDTSITYKYDGNGLRSSKTINGVKHDYYYDENNQLIYEIKEGVYELYYKYDADGNLFSITRYRYSDGEKNVFYAVTNTRGDVIELRAASGGIYAKYVYDSWGKCIAVTNSSGAACSVNTVAVQNSIRYRGYVYDHETGLYYLQSRYYDPETGRFLNADDAEYIGYSGEKLSYNAFAYCENNAVCWLDYSGYSIFHVFLSKLKTIIALLVPIVSISTFAIEKSSVSEAINSMKHLNQSIHYDLKYKLFTLSTVAETRKFSYIERYTIITYSAKKKDWNKIISTVMAKYEKKESFKTKISKYILGGLSFFEKTQFIGYITFAAETIGLAVDVFMMVLCEETLPILKEGLKKINDNDYYTFNWYV